jgi:hypothetical protein
MVTNFARLALEYRITGAPGIGAGCSSIDRAGWPDDLLEVGGTVRVIRRKPWLGAAAEPATDWADDADVLNRLLAWIRPADSSDDVAAHEADRRFARGLRRRSRRRSERSLLMRAAMASRTHALRDATRPLATACRAASSASASTEMLHRTLATLAMFSR